MKILVAATAVLVAVLAVSAAVGAGTFGTDDADKPATAGTDKSPTTVQRSKASIRPAGGLALAIKGTGFVPGENVRVTISETGPQKTRKVKASGTGAFLVRFTGGYDRCRGMTVRAVGDRGSRSSFQLSSVMCAAPGTNQ